MLRHFTKLFNGPEKTPVVKQAPTLGQAKLLRASDVMNYSDTAQWTAFNARNALADGYEANAWVYACIRKKQQAAGSVPMRMSTYNAETEGWEDDPGSVLSRLLQNPNPMHSGSQLVQLIVAQLDIAGAFFGRVIWGGRDGRVPLEIWPLPIGSVAPRFAGGEVVGYRYTPAAGHGSRSTQDLEFRDVLHLMHVHPDGGLKAWSSVISAGKAVDIDNDAANWQKITMQNRGIPDGVFVMQGDVGVDEWEEARRQVRTQYTGVDNAREPWVVANATFEQMSQTLADLDFMNGRKMTRSEICSALDVPEPLVGVYENATLANIETARTIFWRDTLVPLLSDVAEQVSRFFIGPSVTQRIRFDFTNVHALQDSLTEKLSAAETLFRMGVPLQEINRRLDIGLDVERIPSAEVGFASASMMPIHTASGSDGESGGGAASLSDADFDRLMKLVDAVAAGDMTPSTAVAMARAAIPSGISESDLQTIFTGVGDE